MKHAETLSILAVVAAMPIGAQEMSPEPPRGHPQGFFSSKPRFEPGPYVIFFDAGDASVSEGADRILDNAVKHWPEPHKPRFVLCYDPSEEGVAGRELEEARKATVVDELEKRGAVQVLNSVWDCYHRDEPSRDRRARMAMVGVLSMPEPALLSD